MENEKYLVLTKDKFNFIISVKKKTNTPLKQ